MYLHMELQKKMQLHPSLFGPNCTQNLISQLRKEVQCTCNGRHGFIVVAVTSVTSIGEGKFINGSPFATFRVKFNAVVFKPSEGELLESVVTMGNVFKPSEGEILESVVTMVNKMGFFAEAGPVTIFVPNYLVPEDMQFQHGDTPKYTTSDGSVRIETGSEVRIETGSAVRINISGTRTDANSIFCLGSIKEDFFSNPSVNSTKFTGSI